MPNRLANSDPQNDRAVDASSISVFVNCPFDAEYRPVFDAIIFTVVCCGFVPRSAIESGSAGITRIVRILEAINNSKYSIHDLSRSRGEGDYNLARFNMPLELGMAMNRSYVDRNSHEWFVLVPDEHLYSRYISDLAGYDFKYHDGTSEAVIPIVMAWLLTRAEAVGDLEPPDVLGVLPQFRDALAKLTEAWADDVPWPRLVRLARQFVPIPKTNGSSAS